MPTAFVAYTLVLFTASLQSSVWKWTKRWNSQTQSRWGEGLEDRNPLYTPAVIGEGRFRQKYNYPLLFDNCNSTCLVLLGPTSPEGVGLIRISNKIQPASPRLD